MVFKEVEKVCPHKCYKAWGELVDSLNEAICKEFPDTKKTWDSKQWLKHIKAQKVANALEGRSSAITVPTGVVWEHYLPGYARSATISFPLDHLISLSNGYELHPVLVHERGGADQAKAVYELALEFHRQMYPKAKTFEPPSGLTRRVASMVTNKLVPKIKGADKIDIHWMRAQLKESFKAEIEAKRKRDEDGDEDGSGEEEEEEKPKKKKGKKEEKKEEKAKEVIDLTKDTVKGMKRGEKVLFIKQLFTELGVDVINEVMRIIAAERKQARLERGGAAANSENMPMGGGVVTPEKRDTQGVGQDENTQRVESELEDDLA